MVILMVPGFLLLLFGALAVPVFGDIAAAVAAFGAALMLFAAVAH